MYLKDISKCLICDVNMVLGCVYKQSVYQQGQTWKDGCTYSCTCVDATTGKYTCTGL